MASVIPVANETKASFTRQTKDGRTLTYELQVLQQPQRARACGSGAKCKCHPRMQLEEKREGKRSFSADTNRTASADRRPVDPPPVVELKVLEGKEKVDITFQHNANFFLFTTLESARQIAPVRGSSQQAPLPVLTGMPVAGMAYLDRPAAAGYFIFPDLSVRHEGKYRLSFNLFEELKETKDMDLEPPTVDQSKMNGPMAANSHVHFRLEVKSEPFTVFSAKKFPGLAESTPLSRVVAEQGCRVRIRRDVRMRRRDAKPSKDDDYDDYEGQGYHADRYKTPDYNTHAVVDRSRSVSNTSMDGNAHYPPTERRPSTHESNGYYPQPSPYQQAPPVPQPAPTNYQSHLAFGNSATPQYQAPPTPAAYAPTATPSPAPTSSYQQYPQPPAPHSRQMSNGSNYGYPQPYQQQPQQQAPPPPPPAPQQTPPPAHQQQQPPPAYSQPHHQYPETDFRRPQSNHQSSYGRFEYPAVDTRYAAASHSSPSEYRSSTPVSSSTNGSHPAQQLPPLKIVPPSHNSVERKYEAITPGGMPNLMSIPPAPSSSAATSPQPYDTYSQQHHNPYGPTATPTAPPPPSTGKRSYGKVFDQSLLNSTSSNGARPDGNGVGQDLVQVECDGQLVSEEEILSLKMLTYRRADGSRQHKKIPSPV